MSKIFENIMSGSFYSLLPKISTFHCFFQKQFSARFWFPKLDYEIIMIDDMLQSFWVV